MSSYLLEIKSSELTRALRYLRRAEKGSPSFCLKYNERMLTISVGNTHQDLDASG
jgi:hypothetical protein